MSEKRKPPRAGMGRPKGSKNKVSRSVKGALDGLKDAQLVDVLLKGLAADPPASLGYLKLAAEYKWGKPKESVEHTGELRISWQK